VPLISLYGPSVRRRIRHGIKASRPLRPFVTWAIKRSTSQALSFNAPYRSISDPNTSNWQVFGPGEFQQ
jgi:hypothetical protein